MKENRFNRLVCLLFFAAVAVLSSQARSQQIPSDEEYEPLVLDRIIPMPSVHGRADHMTVDVKQGRIFSAIYGNDSVDVLDVHRARETFTIHGGLEEPQGVAFLPDLNRIVVTSDGGGTCTVFNATSYARVGSISFGDDADQIRYDASGHRLYVGYADGAIGMIDTQTWKKLPQTYQLGAHPESFQLDESGHRIFVNLASKGEIAVIHMDTNKIDKWKLPGAWENFPMALDVNDHRIFIGVRRPARMMVLDMDTGQLIASLPGAADSDDMWYDPKEDLRAQRGRIHLRLPTGNSRFVRSDREDPLGDRRAHQRLFRAGRQAQRSLSGGSSSRRSPRGDVGIRDARLIPHVTHALLCLGTY